MTKPLNDALDNLFAGDTGPVDFVPTHAPREVPVYKTAVKRFEEGCDKCRGTGRFVSYTGRVLGECFACKGAGKKVFKNSAADRAVSREKAATRKANREMDIVEAWKAEHQAEAEWLVATAPRWEVAASLLAGLHKYGSLTEKQMGLVRNGIARDAARTAERAQKAAGAPAVDAAGIDRLKASFDQAVAYSAAKGLKMSPRITIGGLTISPAKATSKNPGALYVKSGGEYLGKVANGRFFAVDACTEQQKADLNRFIANPAEAAKVYGQTTGTCCICNATLRSDWKHKGIGPICAEKFGWA
jgi:hypothetical protein